VKKESYCGYVNSWRAESSKIRSPFVLAQAGMRLIVRDPNHPAAGNAEKMFEEVPHA
jgi:hypothetical protein